MYSPADGNQAVSYEKDIQPILNSRCVLCHGGKWTRDGLDLRTYAALMSGSRHEAVIDPGDAESSLLIQKIRRGDMPKRGPKLFPAQLRLLEQWINEGALDN